jgi:apolipoprotein D and lipocalin family protein
MKNLWIYARSVPSKSKLAVMVKKAKELGYDTGKLEFPKF